VIIKGVNVPWTYLLWVTNSRFQYGHKLFKNMYIIKILKIFKQYPNSLLKVVLNNVDQGLLRRFNI